MPRVRVGRREVSAGLTLMPQSTLRTVADQLADDLGQLRCGMCPWEVAGTSRPVVWIARPLLCVDGSGGACRVAVCSVGDDGQGAG